MTSPRVHAQAILNELQRIISADLTGSLGLNLITTGTIDFMPTKGVADTAPMVLIAMGPRPTTFESVELPTPLQAVYNARIIHVRKIKAGEDPVKARIDDAETFAEVLWDNFDMSSLDMTNGQVLWAMLREIEWEPPEDVLVASIRSDLMATAFNMEIVVRTRR